MLGLDFICLTADLDERAIRSRLLTERHFVKGQEEPLGELMTSRLAQAKADWVWAGLTQAEQENSLVIASDTLVSLDGQILGKPADGAEAEAMLHFLSGKTQEVYTAVSIIGQEDRINFVDRAEVDFYPLDDFQKTFIKQYVASGDPLDKAGAYGIQGMGAVLVKAIRGDYYTVMGLPVSRLSRALAKIKLDLA